MGTRIRGIQTVVPRKVLGVADVEARFGPEATERITAMIGVRERRVAAEGQTTGDLAEAAARMLIGKLGVEPETIDGVLLVTQTSDFPTPATACLLQDRLGLPKSAVAFDVNLGCSSYPYGLAISEGLLSAGFARRIIFLTGDTSHRTVSPQDRGTYPLFGDSSVATLLERNGGPSDLLSFDLGTDGSGWANLVTLVGGSRYRTVEEFVARAPERLQRSRDPRSLSMNGNEIFAFVLRVVPGVIRRTLERAGKTAEETDYFFLHQANKFILDNLARKCGLPREKCPITLDRYGNTSGASVALTACDVIPRTGKEGELTAMFVGFGVGYSWGGALVRLRADAVFPIEEV